LFFPFFEEGESYNSIDYLKGKMDNINDANQKVQYLRARWIGLMVEKLSDIFLSHEEEILAGTLECDLMKCLPQRGQELIKRINEFSVEHVYNYKLVVEIEIAGYNVIGGLLKEFINAVIYPALSKSSKIIQLISAQFPITKDRKYLYHDIQSVVDFIAGMTDLYAIDIYRKITGITIPEIR